jgi:hypothetical protein
MSFRYLPAIVALLAGATALRADNASKDEVVPPYELKNHSGFPNATEISRVPFWPIGWVKRTAAAPSGPAPVLEAPKVALDENAFHVTSILIGTGATPSLAVINGRAYSEGEFVRMPRTPGVAPVRVRVQRINDGTVILQHADQVIVASPRRQTLEAKRPDELLLDPDR